MSFHLQIGIRSFAVARHPHWLIDGFILFQLPSFWDQAETSGVAQKYIIRAKQVHQ